MKNGCPSRVTEVGRALRGSNNYESRPGSGESPIGCENLGTRARCPSPANPRVGKIVRHCRKAGTAAGGPAVSPRFDDRCETRSHGQRLPRILRVGLENGYQLALVSANSGEV